jgi:tRNA nucleotidyltransferase/poly(A) polymerase
MFPIRQPFEINLPSELLRLSVIFQEARKELYLVGGAVRDALLGKTPKDFDVATNATPDEIIDIFRARNDHMILEIGKSFGVIKLITKDTLAEYEVATFRSDVGKGRRPDSVIFTTIEEDVKRRDLTINALFYDIQKQEIVDYVGGIKDLEFPVIRTVGDPHERFDEDRLRILRTIRFFTRLKGAGMCPNTLKAIKTNNSLAGVSPERIRDEFLKSLHSAWNVNYLLLILTSLGFWEQIFPGLTVNQEFVETKNVPVQLACLLRDNDPKKLGKVLNELKYSSEEVAQVKFLVQFQTLTVEDAYRARKFFKAGSSYLSEADVREFTVAVGKPSKDLTDAFFRYEPSVTGDQLIAEGLQGAALGKEQLRRETELFKSLLT